MLRQTWLFITLMGLLMLVLNACGGGGSPVNTVAQDGFDGDLSIELRPLATVQNSPIIPIRVDIPPTNASQTIPVWIRLGYKLSLKLSERIRTMTPAEGSVDFVDPATVLLVPPGGASFTFYWDAIRDLGVDADFDTVVVRAGVLRTNADDPREAVCDFQPVIQVAFGSTAFCTEFPPRIDGETLPEATIGEPYSTILETQGGTEPLFFQLLDEDTGEPVGSNQIGFGLSLDGLTGEVTGTPTAGAPANLDFFVRLLDDCSTNFGTDDNNNTELQSVRQGAQGTFFPSSRFDQARFVIPIVGGQEPQCVGDLPTIVSLVADSATIGDEYTFQLVAEGGEGTLTWEVEDDFNLPDGLSMDSTGRITGVITETGDFNLPIIVRDSCEQPRESMSLVALRLNCSEQGPVFDFGGTAGIRGGQGVGNFLPPATIGVPYDESFMVFFANRAGNVVRTDGSIPDGLMEEFIESEDGFSITVRISGTPSSENSAPATRLLVYQATDACAFGGLMTDGFVNLPIEPAPGCPTLIITTESLPPAMVGAPYSFQMEAAGGQGTLSWFDVGGGKGGPTLPNGLTISPSGLISGTPTFNGLFDVEIAVTDQCDPPQAQSRDYLLEVTEDCPALTMDEGSLPPAINGEPYFGQLTAQGGVEPYSFSQIDGNLPSGLTLNTDGSITGTPNDKQGDYEFTAQVMDSCPDGAQSDSLNFGLTLIDPCDPLTVNPSTLPGAVNGETYPPTQITTTGGSGQITFQLTGGLLPSGLSLSPDGLISGTPADVAGDYPITITAQDNCPQGIQSDSEDFVVTLSDPGCPPAAITTEVLPDAQNGNDYFFVLQGTGVEPFTWSISKSSADFLPGGLNLDPDGTISGSADAEARDYFIQFVLEDSCEDGPQFDTRILILTVTNGDCVPLTITTKSLPPATNGEAYELFLAAAGGEGILSWALNELSDPLPDGLILDTNGILSGTPADSAMEYNLIFDVMDECLAGAQTDTATLPLTLEDPACDPLDPPANDPIVATNRVPYSFSHLGTGGFPPYFFEIDTKFGDGLPNGLSMDSDGFISGEPFDSIGDYTYRVLLTDSCPDGPQFSMAEFTLRLTGCEPMSVPLNDPPVGFNGDPYSHQHTVTGGEAPVRFSIDPKFGDGLPPGLEMDPMGVITGFIDASEQDYVYRVIADDACPFPGSQSSAMVFTLTVTSNPCGSAIDIGNEVFPDPRIADFYREDLIAFGGVQPYTWSLVGGTLPEGMQVQDNDGWVIDGEPTNPGQIDEVFVFTLRVTDSCSPTPQFTDMTFQFTLRAPD